MRTPQEILAMLSLAERGWGSRRIARELGCSRTTVQRYLSAGAPQPFKRAARPGKLTGLETWLAETFRQHRGNADVVRQELKRQHGIEVSLRTVERAVQHLRQELEAEQKATVRFETPAGRQLQIDFGEAWVWVGGERTKVHVFVATLGYSRRNYAAVFRNQRQSSWFHGLESAFSYFGGLPEEVLIDNARAMVAYHNAQTREVLLNARFSAFTRYWGLRPVACQPLRARTKGKDESGVKYVKRNALAGHRFASWEALEAHLAWWMREVSDVREHGTTGEQPIVRFINQEQAALRPHPGKPPFLQIRDLIRRVHNDACVEVDTNAYSVPWRLIGETVTVQVAGGFVRVSHAGQEVAVHRECGGRRARQVLPQHFVGIVGGPKLMAVEPANQATITPPLLRPLAEYEAVAGGAW